MYALPTLIGSPSAPGSYGNITTFGSSSAQIVPPGSVLSNGYLPGQGFPAENENYLMFNITNSINAISNDIYNIHSEILNVLSSTPAGGISPNNGNNQLLTAINAMILYQTQNSLGNSYLPNFFSAYGGQLGIGKSPSFTLDVNGTINAVTDIKIGGSSLSLLFSPLSNGTIFTSNGSFTVPAGVNFIYVSGTAAGGNGGQGGGLAGNSGGGGGGGGGGGQVFNRRRIPVTPGQVLTITIGAVGSNSIITGSGVSVSLYCCPNGSNGTNGAGGTSGNGGNGSGNPAVIVFPGAGSPGYSGSSPAPTTGGVGLSYNSDVGGGSGGGCGGESTAGSNGLSGFGGSTIYSGGTILGGNQQSPGNNPGGGGGGAGGLNAYGTPGAGGNGPGSAGGNATGFGAGGGGGGGAGVGGATGGTGGAGGPAIIIIQVS